MNIQDLTNQITSSPQPVYLVQSEQLYLLEKARQAFKSLIAPEEQAMNYASYDMDEVDLEIALADAATIPFFGDRRVVILEKPVFLTGETKKQRANHNLEALLTYLEHPEPDTALVFLAPYENLDKRKKVVKTLLKEATVFDFGNISERDIQTLINNDISEHGFKIDQQALNLLIQRTNADLTIIMQELGKLYLYCYQEKMITAPAVADLVTKSLTENVFDLVTAVLARKTSTALTLYHELRANGEEPIKMNALLLGQFRLLLQVKGLMPKVRNEKDLATQLKVHPYRVKLANQASRKFSLQNLSQAYLGLYDLEKQLKSTQRDPEMLFELFMINFVNN